VNQQSDQSVDQLNNNNTIINNNNPLDVVFNPTSENNDNINPTPDTPVGRTPHNSNDSITTIIVMAPVLQLKIQGAQWIIINRM
jgi:hypothetical protein